MTAWPAAGTETHSWEGRDRTGEPYTASIPARLAGEKLELDAETAALVEDAALAAARYDTESRHHRFDISPALLSLEARASSDIEGVRAEHLDIGLARLGRPSASAEARLIIANELAIAAALSPDATAIQVQEALLRSSRPEYTGGYRAQQVWIGSSWWSNSPHSASFVPPHHSRVPELMADADEFARRVDIQIVAHAAVAHAQFEAVHPFPDGNGRTGRALAQQMLRRHQLTQHTLIPLSVNLQDRRPYIQGLIDYRGGHVEPIIYTLARAVLAGVRVARSLLDELTSVVDEWEARTTGRAGSAAIRLLPVIATTPVIDAATAARLLSITVQNAQAGIDRLVGDGILTQAGEGRRNRVWVATDALSIHDALLRPR